MLKEYYFKFSNGAVRKLTQDGANRFARDAQLVIIDANEDGQFKNNKRIRDGWQPGYQPQLGMVVTCPHQYQRILKERGLIEIGNQKPRSHEEDVKELNKKQRLETYSEESLRDMAKLVGGLDLSDGDIRMLRDEAAKD
jgi:hypothetical protein